MSVYEDIDREINTRRASIPEDNYRSEKLRHLEELYEQYGGRFKKTQIKNRWDENEAKDKKALKLTNLGMNQYHKSKISFDDISQTCVTDIVIGNKFELRETGIFEQVVAGREVHLNRVSTTLILPVAIYESLETGEQSILLAYKVFGQVKYVKVPFTQISIMAEIVKLSAYGIDVTSNNGRSIIEFLVAARFEFKDFLKLKRLVRKNGWGKFNGKFFYCLGRTVFSDEVEIEREVLPEDRKVVDAIKSSGSKKQWLMAMNWIFGFPVARFYIACGLAAPLLKPLNCPNFIVHLFGNSTVGKSTVLMAYLSFFGIPTDEGLKLTWNMTQNGPEGRMNQFSGLGSPFDDSSQLNRDFLNAFVYLLTNKVGKQRAQINGLAMPTNSSDTVAMSNGESPLRLSTSRTGVLVRVLEIALAPFLGESVTTSEIENFSNTISNNYGFGEKYFKFVVDLVNDDESLNKIKNRYSELKDKVASLSSNNYVGRMASYFAVALLALELLEEQFPQLNIDLETTEHALNLIVKEQEERIREQSDIDERAFKYCIEHYLHLKSSSNDHERLSIKPITRRDQPSNSGLAFLPVELEKILTKGGYDFQASVSFFKSNGWLWIKDGRLWPVFYNGHSVRAYVLDLNKAKGLGIIVN